MTKHNVENFQCFAEFSEKFDCIPCDPVDLELTICIYQAFILWSVGASENGDFCNIHVISYSLTLKLNFE